MIRLFINALVAILLMTGSAQSLQDHDHEAHDILKRMAEMDEHFEGHDVARIFSAGGRRLEKRDLHPRRKAFTNRDSTSLQIQLSSGTKLNLALTPAGIVSPDTVVSYRTVNGHTETKWDLSDCFSHGHLEDSSGRGFVAISHCNGVFGYAKTPAYDYLVYPSDVGRSKRDAEGDYDIHLMWRRSLAATRENGEDPLADADVEGTIVTDFADEDNDDEEEEDEEANETHIPIERDLSNVANEATVREVIYPNVVVELAIFVDESYWNKLHRLLPGREKDYILTVIAGTQALFGNPEKIDFNIQIKVKLLEFWKKNPDAYVFQNSLGSNLKAFCQYTRGIYSYDVHGLFSGIDTFTGIVGLAYVGRACKSNGCFAKKTFGIRSFSLVAHELGHTIGMPDLDRSKCPQNETYVGGFMGGGRKFNFSPCMKRYLSKFLKSRKSNCLYTESSSNRTSEKGTNLPRVFPGQARSPDDLCEFLIGRGYRYVPLEKSLGHSTCRWLVCYNENKTSDEFGRAVRMLAQPGFPCGDEGFCLNEGICSPWNTTKTVFSYEALKKMTSKPVWSEWSTELSACSRSCGTGVRTRRRECQVTGYNLAPYCPGMSVKAETCNTDPCPGDPDNIVKLWKARGDEVCKKFKEKNVTLKLKKSRGYFPISSGLSEKDIYGSASLKDVRSKSCLLKCQRNPNKNKGALDAFRPDGTPCFDTERRAYELRALRIELKCVRGSCLEFSDCTDSSQSKDDCGICGGDGSRCVNLSFDSRYDVPMGTYSHLTLIPPGATNIFVFTNRKKNNGVNLEMWRYDNQTVVIGKGGVYPGKIYENSESVNYAGTSWFYKQTTAYLHALGPTQEAVIIKAYRQGKPIKLIVVKYAKSEESQEA